MQVDGQRLLITLALAGITWSGPPGRAQGTPIFSAQLMRSIVNAQLRVTSIR